MSTSSEEQPNKRLDYRWIKALVVGVLVLIGLVAVLWFPVQDAREAAQRASCIGQLKIFGGGMHTYEAEHDCFPPAYLTDTEGRPAHSWRVLLLPTQGVQALYEAYRFDEAWNSAHNLDVAEGLPIGMSGIVPMYHCPTDRNSDWLHTSFVMVVGPDTVSPGSTTRQIEDFVDGTSRTIVIAEMSESGIHWTEPRDLDFSDMSFHMNDPKRKCIRSKHAGVANAMFADGSVYSIHEDIDPEVLKGLLTIAGGEPVSWDDF